MPSVDMPRANSDPKPAEKGKKKRDSKADDILAEAKEQFGVVQSAEDENRQNHEDDKAFYRGEEDDQWVTEAYHARMREGRPAITINTTQAFCRQVINDARQNKPSIKVHPADSGADPDTAEIIQELIRNIEVTSDADVAYDTAAENAVQAGWGYWKVDLEQAYDDSFDLDIKIKRVAEPLTIYADPFSTAADSSDWKLAFDVERITKKQFEDEWGEKSAVDWGSEAYRNLAVDWYTDEMVLIARYWKRERGTKPVVVMSDGSIFDPAHLEEIDPILGIPNGKVLEIQGITVARQDKLPTHKVTRYTLTGAEVLETYDWPGKYIPIVPVYGNELWLGGKRRLTSLFHEAKPAQMLRNFWRSVAAEAAGNSPRTPFVGEEGSFIDEEKWATANRVNHAYLEHKKGSPPPQRQPYVGPDPAAMQEALNAADDMKAIMGLYDASLGAKSNETSGKAIMARQREGDVSTFNFQDNVSRAIRHTGRILIDLIPHVYQGQRVIRVMGEDNKARNIQLGQPTPQLDRKTGQPMVDEMGEPIVRIYDLTSGKYDLTVTTGPSFTSRREEAAMQMTELIRAFPQAAPIVGPALAKNLDWPGADDIAEEMERMAKGAVPPEVQKQIEEGKQQLQQFAEENQKLKAENLKLKTDTQVKQGELVLKSKELQIKEAELALKHEEIGVKRAEIDAEVQVAHLTAAGVAPAPPDDTAIKAYDAETKRLNVLLPYMTDASLASMGLEDKEPEMTAAGTATKAAKPTPEAPVEAPKPKKRMIKYDDAGEISGVDDDGVFTPVVRDDQNRIVSLAN